MPELPTRCPACQSALAVMRLRCDHCNTHVEGAFELPGLLSLSSDDLSFIIRFVKASGSLKEMARQCNQSYPTIRNRLNEIIARLGEEPKPGDDRRQAILDAIAKGILSAAEGERKLREVPS